MNDPNVQNIIHEAQLARKNPVDRQQLRKLKKQLHKLAESGDLLAKEFFLSCLSDPDPDWRLHGLRNLGFHYSFSPESETCNKIRTLLLEDDDSDIRMSAASVLGIRSRWLDSALLKSLTSDPDEFVRIVSFESLIQLAGTPIGVAFKASEKAKKGEIEPTFAEIKRIICEYGIEADSLSLS